MSVRYLSSILMGLGILGMTIAVVWWYEYYMDLKEFLNARTPPPVGCLYKLIDPCRFGDAFAVVGGVRPYRPELLWAGAASFAIGSAMEFLQVVRREIGTA